MYLFILLYLYSYQGYFLKKKLFSSSSERTVQPGGRLHCIAIPNSFPLPLWPKNVLKPDMSKIYVNGELYLLRSYASILLWCLYYIFDWITGVLKYLFCIFQENSFQSRDLEVFQVLLQIFVQSPSVMFIFSSFSQVVSTLTLSPSPLHSVIWYICPIAYL